LYSFAELPPLADGTELTYVLRTFSLLFKELWRRKKLVGGNKKGCRNCLRQPLEVVF